MTAEDEAPETVTVDTDAAQEVGAREASSRGAHTVCPADVTVQWTCLKGAERGERGKGPVRGRGTGREERAWHSVFKACPKVQGQKPAVKVTDVVLNRVGAAQA